MRTYVIAEAAATHDGRLDQAHALVELAASIGADAVKFQGCSDPSRRAEGRHIPGSDLYRLLECPVEWHAKLASLAEVCRLDYLCTVYLPEDIAVVAPYVSRFKIASFEANDSAFLQAHEGYGKNIIISTGMDGGDVNLNLDLTFLHCVSAYPAPIDELNLAVMRDEMDGLSDHTRHPWTGALAVAAGAGVIEFHVRLWDTEESNPDYAVARTPEMAAEYVANIRTAEMMLGDGRRRVMPSEEPMLRYRVLA